MIPVTMFLTLFLTSAFGYFVGAIPSGYWFAKFFFGVDITKHGSGNIGATNVARVFGSKKYFFLIFGFDCGKAWLFLKLLLSGSSRIEGLMGAEFYAVYLGALFLIIGNSYSLFLGFRGGKGVATAVGILSALAPWHVVATFLVVWFSVLVITKNIAFASVSSIGATMLCALARSDFGDVPFLGLMLFCTVWLVFRHLDNLKAVVR